jgi:hypothetical protein
VRNVAADRTEIHVLERGLPEKKGPRVAPGLPSALAKADAAPADTDRPRTALARWLADPEHPLTARVFVNRVWHYHFGQGIVETPNDFGANGGEPSHPELLDCLANEFVRGGMRLKPLHRLIVLSNTYRQSSTPHSALRIPHSLDHFPRPMLAVSGRLNLKAGGESVIVPVEQDLVDLLYAPSQWTVTPDPREHDRRSIYLLAKRNLRLPFAQVFDQPDLQTSCPRRESSTHALQALELLNGQTSNRLAEAFALRLEQEAGGDPARQIELAWQLAAGREPNAAERQRALEFLATQPLSEFALAMFNLNAFLYVD